MQPGSRKIFGIMIIASALVVMSVATAYLAGEYERSSGIEEVTIQNDGTVSNTTDAQIQMDSVQSTMLVTAWISFVISTIFAIIMTITGIRFLFRHE